MRKDFYTNPPAPNTPNREAAVKALASLKNWGTSESALLALEEHICDMIEQRTGGNNA